MPDNNLVYPDYFQNYLDLVPKNPLLPLLRESATEVDQFLAKLPEEKADFRYADGKWTVKEVLQHCIDSERVFAYRALCIARGETQTLPGFDQDLFAAHVKLDLKSLEELKTELSGLRQTSLQLFSHLEDAALDRQGRVGDYTIDTRSLGYLIIGHLRHHFKILQLQYGC